MDQEPERDYDYCCACPDLFVNSNDETVCRNCATCLGVSLDKTLKRKDYTTQVYSYTDFAKSMPKDEQKGSVMSSEQNVEKSMLKDFASVREACGDYVPECQLKEAMHIYMNLQPAMKHRAGPKRASLAACVWHACANNGVLLFKGQLVDSFRVTMKEFDRRFEEVRNKAKQRGLKISDVSIRPGHVLMEICKKEHIPKDIAERALDILEVVTDDVDLERHGTKSLISAILAILYGDEEDPKHIAKMCSVTETTMNSIRKKMLKTHADLFD